MQAQPSDQPIHRTPHAAADDVEFSFARSSGAGGQNVNKVNTKVDMRFELDKQDWIPEEIKDAIRRAVRGVGPTALVGMVGWPCADQCALSSKGKARRWMGAVLCLHAGADMCAW